MIPHHIYRLSFWFSLVLLLPITLRSIDNGHFYRATNLWLEPRLEYDWLSTLDAWVGAGSTKTSIDGNKNNVCLFDIYGLSNMQELGVNVPGKNLANLGDFTLTQLAFIPGLPGFATFSIGGEFRIIELNFLFEQNFTRGFFFGAHLPVRHFKFENITFCDLSPLTQDCPNIHNPVWQQFKNQFETLLASFDICLTPQDEWGVGDLSLYLGWTHNYTGSALDFVDFTFRAGVLAPTGKAQNVDQIFSLPFGYNKHWAIPLHIDLAFGGCEWFSLATHFDALVFFDRTECIRIKTAPNQSGFIKLTKTEAHVDRGTLWIAGAYAKADHFIRGLSLLFGYSFTDQNEDSVIPCNPQICDICAVNTDEMLQGFQMHTIHFYADYDFTQECDPWGMHIGLFYNRIVGGERIFRTDMAGAQMGVNITWEF